MDRRRRTRHAFGAGLAVAALVAAGVTLTGSAAAGAPAYPADRPNTLAGARSAAAVSGAWMSERLSSATDEDWYRVHAAHATTVTATLGSLPADYSLSVYDAAGTLVRSADRKNLGFERVTWRAAAGDYFVRVDAVRGFSATKLYALRIRGLQDGVVVLDQSPVRHYSTGEVDGYVELVNSTPKTWYQVDDIRVQLLNAQGRVVGQADGAPTITVMRPGRTSKLQWFTTGPAPAGVTAVRFVPVVEAVAPVSQPALTLQRGPRTTHPDGYPIYHGTVSTTSQVPVEDAIVGVTYYDARGDITTHMYWGVGTIPAHGSRAFAVPFQSLLYTPQLTKPNVVTVQADMPW